MRAHGAGKPGPSRIKRLRETRDLGPAVQATGHSVFVAGVQGIVSAGNEDLAPLQKTGRQKPCDSAEDDFLDKGRVHLACLNKQKRCREGPTKSPIAGCS